MAPLKKMVDEAYERTKKILGEHKKELEQLAELLLKKEVIFKDDLEKIFGKRKFQTRHEEVEENSKNSKKSDEDKVEKGVSENGSEKKEESSEENPVSESSGK